MHAYARVVICLAYVLRADELEREVVIGLHGRYLAERPLCILVGKREAANRRVEVLGAPPVNAHQRADEHASLDDNAVTPGREGYPLEQPFKQVTLHHELRGHPSFLGAIADDGLELHRIFSSHSSTSR